MQKDVNISVGNIEDFNKAIAQIDQIVSENPKQYGKYVAWLAELYLQNLKQDIFETKDLEFVQAIEDKINEYVLASPKTLRHLQTLGGKITKMVYFRLILKTRNAEEIKYFLQTVSVWEFSGSSWMNELKAHLVENAKKYDRFSQAIHTEIGERMSEDLISQLKTPTVIYALTSSIKAVRQVAIVIDEKGACMGGRHRLVQLADGAKLTYSDTDLDYIFWLSNQMYDKDFVKVMRPVLNDMATNIRSFSLMRAYKIIMMLTLLYGLEHVKPVLLKLIKGTSDAQLIRHGFAGLLIHYKALNGEIAKFLIEVLSDEEIIIANRIAVAATVNRDFGAKQKAKALREAFVKLANTPEGRHVL